MVTSFRGDGLTVTASPTIENVIIKNNSALAGGGVHIQTGDPIFNNVDFLNNVSTVDYDGYSLGSPGGALLVAAGSQSIFTNCTIACNQSGGSWWWCIRRNSNTRFYSCKLLWEQLHISRRRLWYFMVVFTVDVANSIFWSDNLEQILFQSDGDAKSLTVALLHTFKAAKTVLLSITMAPLPGAPAYIDVNPILLDTANGNVSCLKDWSPAIGTGTATGDPTVQIEGNPCPNPAGSNPDMGAYENKWCTPQNAPPVLTALSDVSVNEDESITVTLEPINADSADNDDITFSATS